jgi:hypothetical protein
VQKQSWHKSVLGKLSRLARQIRPWKCLFHLAFSRLILTACAVAHTFTALWMARLFYAHFRRINCGAGRDEINAPFLRGWTLEMG